MDKQSYHQKFDKKYYTSDGYDNYLNRYKNMSKLEHVY